MHLSCEEREKIFLLSSHGKTKREIGRQLGRHHTVISRELERNHSPNGIYSPAQAQRTSLLRRSQANSRNPLKDERIFRYVKEKLLEDWSPEEISGRIKLDLPGKSIGRETIYAHIYRKENRHLGLWVYLRRHRPRRQPKHSRKVRRETIPNRIFIDQRPSEINDRKRIGHWESDLLLGSRETREAASVTVERKTNYVVIAKLNRPSATEKQASLVAGLKKFPPWLRKSITFDNGLENACHEEVSRELQVETYFCHPYSSFERGTVENTNGLIRQYLPKRSSFKNVTQREVNLIASYLNNRPRKKLGYLTPAELFQKSLSGAF